MKRLKLALIYTAHMLVPVPAFWAWTHDRASDGTLDALRQTFGGS